MAAIDTMVADGPQNLDKQGDMDNSQRRLCACTLCYKYCDNLGTEFAKGRGKRCSRCGVRECEGYKASVKVRKKVNKAVEAEVRACKPVS
jgi:hypothetical protein